MPNSLVPTRLRPGAIRRGVVRAYQGHAAQTRARREHDEAIARDPSFELEHGLQVARSVERGQGGCPYCGN
jgi:hypothetical protein